MTTRVLLSELPGYGKLQALADGVKAASIEQFLPQPNRASDFTLAAAGLGLDFSSTW